MFTRAALATVVSLSIAAFASGCAGQASGDDVGSDEGAATTATALARSYEGTIGNLKIMLRVSAEGANVSGSYFYADKQTNGDVIVLKGTASGNRLAMTESVKGATTGTFNGTITSAGITGTWKTPNGATTLPLTLTAITPGTVRPITRKIADKAPAAAHGATATDCSLDAEYIEVFGLADAKAEATINAALAVPKIERNASGKCDYASDQHITQTVVLNDKGFLTIEVGNEYDGGAYPDTSSNVFNFKIADGSTMTAKDFFGPGAAAGLRPLVLKNVTEGFTGEEADEKQAALDSFDMHWGDDVDLDSLQFGLGADGIHLNMHNDYSHAEAALAPALDLPWSEIKSFIKSDSPILPLVK